MKKVMILSLMLIIIITGCYKRLDNVEIPKGYINQQEFYDENGFQDYTDYAKYIYSTQDIIVNNNKYKKITTEDAENIKCYFENFHSRMKASNRLDEYDFDESIINEGDYIRIKTKEGQKIGDSRYEKYDNYSIYFFDIETFTLYYIHSNI